jgi:hypothetical protein
VRLPEKCFEWLAGAWKLGVILCPGIWRISIWWDSQPYSLTITLPLMHIWFEHDGGNSRSWEWTILRLVVGKQEIRADLALNYWGLGVVVIALGLRVRRHRSSIALSTARSHSGDGTSSRRPSHPSPWNAAR